MRKTLKIHFWRENSNDPSARERKQIAIYRRLRCNFRLESISKWLPLHDYCSCVSITLKPWKFFSIKVWTEEKVKLWKRIGSWVNKRFSQRHLLSSSKLRAKFFNASLKWKWRPQQKFLCKSFPPFKDNTVVENSIKGLMFYFWILL